MIMVRFLVSSLVGQVTRRSSARVSLKYLTTAFGSLPGAVVGRDFDFATVDTLSQYLVQLILFPDAIDESGNGGNIFSAPFGWDRCGGFFEMCNFFRHTLYRQMLQQF
jgi:hypothetical protein